VGIVLDWVVLDGPIAQRGSVWFGLVCVLVLREARKCRTEQKSCKSELGGLSVKPHGLVSSCGHHVLSAQKRQCIAGKFALTCISRIDQALWIEWFVIRPVIDFAVLWVANRRS
jgi:hypothetical protein